jgi:hypothetical protein
MSLRGLPSRVHQSRQQVALNPESQFFRALNEEAHRRKASPGVPS